MDDVKDSVKGLGVAVAAAHDPEALPPNVVRGEQMALLPLRNTKAGTDAAADDGQPKRGPGRPPGAKNKSTEEWTRYILSRYPSPLLALAEVYSRSLTDLATELLGYAGAASGAKLTYAQVVELLKLQLGAAKELAPYMHQKQPMALQGGENGLINLFIGQDYAGDVKASHATSFDLEILDVENEENQGLSGDDLQEFNESEFNASGEGQSEGGAEDETQTD